MQRYFKTRLTSFKTWSSTHSKILLLILGLLALSAVVVYAFQVLPAWKVWLAIWITAVTAPVILGMLGKVGFKWAILWECVMFFPVVLLLVLFVQDIRSYFLKGVAK